MRHLSFFFMLMIAFMLPANAASILHDESSAPDEVASAIEDIVVEWASKFNRGDWMRIKEMWDVEEETPIYLGEERDQWIIGQEGLDQYFNPPSENTQVESVIIQPYRLRVRLISDSIAVATWENSLDFKMKTRPAIQDDYRVNAVFRKKGDEWLFIQYAEMAMSPLTYIEHLYRRGVSEGFPENGQPYDAGRSGYQTN